MKFLLQENVTISPQTIERIGSMLSVFGVLIVVLFVLAFVAAIISLVFWVLMLIDCAKRKFKNDNDKVIWILIIVFLHWIGALVYYFAVKRQDRL